MTSHSLDDMLDPAVMAVPGMAALVPRFSLVIDDLAHLSDDVLQTRSLPAFPTLALWVLDPMYRDELRGKLDQLGARAKGITMTIAEFLEEKERKEGEEKGRLDTLRHQLLVKFKLSTLDAAHEARLRAGPPEAIDRYVERVRIADSLAAVFED